MYRAFRATSSGLAATGRGQRAKTLPRPRCLSRKVTDEAVDDLFQVAVDDRRHMFQFHLQAGTQHRAQVGVAVGAENGVLQAEDLIAGRLHVDSR